MWNNDPHSLNGERLFQTFNIHTGKGSSSISTKFTMLNSIVGDFFCEINAETFTKQPMEFPIFFSFVLKVVFANPNPDNNTKPSLILKWGRY